MSDNIKKLLQIMSETTTSGSVAPVANSIGNSMLKRPTDTIFAAENVDPDADTGLEEAPQVESPANFGLWKNSAVIGAEQYGKHGRKKSKVDKTQMYPQLKEGQFKQVHQAGLDALNRNRQSDERNAGLNEPDESPYSFQNTPKEFGTWHFTVNGEPIKKDGEVYYSSNKQHNSEVLDHLSKKARKNGIDADFKVVQGLVKLGEAQEVPDNMSDFPEDMADYTEEDWERWDAKVNRAFGKDEKNDEKANESAQQCSECGGPAFSDMILAEAKDACYNKVKSRYKVWPSAYASGALVKCRKVGAANWGNSTKESVEEGVAEGKDELQTELKTINQQLKDALKEYKKNHQMHPNQYIEKVKKIKDRREELIKQLQQGVAEGKEEDYSDKFVQSQIDYNEKHLRSGNAADRSRIAGSLYHYESIKNKRIKNGTWKLNQGVAEGFDAEYDDEAGSAETNLHTAARAIEGLIKTIQDRDNLPEWVQEKIAKAEAMLVSSWDHLLSQKEQGHDPQINESEIAESLEYVSEDLRKWFKEKWVRFGPDGKIRGDCARGSSSEGKPKCLPQSKAHSLGKKGRASSAAKKRREDPNADRSGKAKNVATKVKESTKEVAEAEQLDEKGKGLWANIRAKRARGEKMRKPGSKGSPSNADIKSIRKASNESVADDFENDGEWAGTGATDQAAATAFAGSEASHASIENATSLAEAEITEEMIADRLKQELALFKSGTKSKDKSIGKRPATREVQTKTPAKKDM